MTTTGIDYSFSEPDFNLVKSRGYSFAISYFSKDQKKDWSKEELQRALNAGLSVGAVYETTANRAAAGFDAGIIDAKDAQAQAAEVGYTGILYFAVDFGAAGENLNKVEQYFRGINTIISASNVGVYGSYYVVERIHTKGLATWLWQASAWSGGKFYEPSHIYQNANKASGIGGTDWNLGVKDDMGLMSKGSIPTPSPEPIPTPAPPASSPILKKGSTGDYVKQAQLKLNITADGIFGSQTEAAVKLFQKTHNLSVDGIIGPNTWRELNAIPSTPAAPTPSSPGFPLNSGYYGIGGHDGKNAADTSNIKKIQVKVSVKADGIFGPKTTSAVKYFQKHHALSDDGKVGPKTWNKLFK